MGPVFGPGMRGDIIATLQSALMKQQVPDTNGALQPALADVETEKENSTVFSSFGPATTRAVERVQQKTGRVVNGVVDETLWTSITGEAWPSKFERYMTLTASFEGHGYSHAAGDADHAGITWGIVGFTLLTKDDKEGSLQKLLKDVIAQQHAVALKAFEQEKLDRLTKALASSGATMHQFARDVSKGKKIVLLDEWEQAFDVLGRDANVRDMQRAAARHYFDDGMALASDFGTTYDMQSERTEQFFFDFAVNNGKFLKPKKGPPVEEPEVRARLGQLPADAPLSRRLRTIYEVLAKHRAPSADIINSRKGTIARGYGTVNLRPYRLANWGLPDAPAPGPPSAFVVMGLDPSQENEQLALAASLRDMNLHEPALAVEPEQWPKTVGIVPIGEPGAQSMSMRGVARTGTPFSGQGSALLLHAIELMLREPPVVLAVFGQATPLAALITSEVRILGRDKHAKTDKRPWAGLALTADDRLTLVRSRPNENGLDITSIRNRLSSCRLLMLFCGYGIPSSVMPDFGRRWQDWIGGVSGQKPIVLGWYGNVQFPQDSNAQSVSLLFLNQLRQLHPGASIDDVCNGHAEDVVECWGRACHEAFAQGRQGYLWRSDGLFGIDVSLCGAGAITSDGTVMHANPDFPTDPNSMVVAL